MENNGKCYMCKKFIRYYTRGRIQFNRTKYGWCSEKRCSVNSMESCCKFKYRVRTKKSREALQLYLSNLLTEIGAIKMLLEEERDENV